MSIMVYIEYKRQIPKLNFLHLRFKLSANEAIFIILGKII